jgi:hypothetical protein
MFSYKFPVKSLEDKIGVCMALKRICIKLGKNEIQNLLIQLRAWAGMYPVGREYQLYQQRNFRKYVEKTYFDCSG